MQCVAVDGNGFVVVDAAPVASCTGFVLMTPQEYQESQSVMQPLALDDGVTIGVAVLGAMAVAWVWKTLRDFARGWYETGE